MYQSHLYNITPNWVEPISSSLSLTLFAVNEYSLREWLDVFSRGGPAGLPNTSWAFKLHSREIFHVSETRASIIGL